MKAVSRFVTVFMTSPFPFVHGPHRGPEVSPRGRENKLKFWIVKPRLTARAFAALFVAWGRFGPWSF